MEKILLVAWTVLGLLSVTNASSQMVSYDAECGGTGDNANYCDFSKGLYCDKQFTACAASTGVCHCVSGKTWIAADTTCKTPVTAENGNCSAADSKCMGTLECTSDTCSCPAQTTYNANYKDYCLPDAKKVADEACTNDNSACESGFCDTNTCACPTGYIKDGNKFCQTPKVTEACDAGGPACQGSNIECASSTCTCVSTGGTFVAWTDTTKGCKINGAVTAGSDCESDNSCDGTVMTCLPCGKGTAVAQKKCQVVATTNSANVGSYGNECGGVTGNGCDASLGLECIVDYSGCKIGKCACPTGKSWDTGKCKEVVGYDVTCDSDKVCTTPYTCTSNKCACASGSTYDNTYFGTCKDNNTKIYGVACGADNECESGKCSTTCVCQAGHYPEKKKCRPPMHGETCDKDNDHCAGDSVECGTDSKCTCKGTKVVNPDRLDCRDSGSKEQDNQVCSSHDQCKDSLVCVACGAGTADGEKKCRVILTTSTSGNGSNIATFSISTFFLIAAYFLIV